MGSTTTSVVLLCLLVGTAAAHSSQTVFLDKQQASSLISRQKRNVDGGNPASLEKVCMEKVCTYEQARSVFQDSYRTDIFWAVYVDGDQCAEKPCKNGAMCSDSVGGYDCVCKSGFVGVHCENDTTLCPLEKNKGCSQFCKPGYVSYQCSCAPGWTLSRIDREKCQPLVTHPCGKVEGTWSSKLSANKNSNFNGVSCGASDCPWQALLKNTESPGFCSGVILSKNLVLTTAQCAQKHRDFRVSVGRRTTNPTEYGEQAFDVKVIHIHPRYIEGRPENDLAVIELQDPIVFKREVRPVCLPERDFAESILMTADSPAVVTGWKETPPATSFQGALTINHLEYVPLQTCLETHSAISMTNKMGCTSARANADCAMSSGSPLLAWHRDVFFLTGVVSRPAGADCTKGYIFQKVSRYLGWLQQLMGSRS